MPHFWQLQEAKNRFSEVVSEALHHGPQIVTRHGEEVVAIVSIKDFRKARKFSKGLVEFLHRSPLKGVALDLERNKEFPRGITL